MKKRKATNWLVTLFVIIAALLGVNRQSVKNYIDQELGQNLSEQIKTTNKNNGIQNVKDDNLRNLTFKSGGTAYLKVNGNKSTLSTAAWKINKISYGSLDNLNRTTMVTGYLERRNLVRSSTRTSQDWRPTGWHQRAVSINGRRIEILNRGHLLAYSITGKFNKDGQYNVNELGSLDNPKNLATQTEFSNQKTMQIFEGKVRNALEANKKVIYQVSTVFKNKDLMPIGYHLQALSTDKSLDFNVFVWNVEPGIKFDYATGRSRIDRSMKVSDSTE
ncbi:DNA/RNA non-specific endonuclease [Pediococcus ethanolidurans]|uniref:DNA/RNA non-specific endonuclease n=1 Tax=Pediococcus ethanolidurans TaxID=319653 RepID=UPI00345EAA74